MQFPTFNHIYHTLISTSSISSPDQRWDQGNQEVITHLAQWLEDLGFAVEIEEVEKGKMNLLAKKGEGTGGLLLAGHTDTVPYDEGRWDYDPLALTETHDRFYGLGTADMKGFFAFIIEAVKEFDLSGQTKPLYVLATCDEETSMLGARHFTESSTIKPDYCIIGEPTSLKPIHGHKGHIAQSIRVTGKSGHSSDPANGINAIEIMNEVMFALMQLKQRLIKDYHHPGFAIPHPTLNLGHIHGGDSPNRICGCCELHFDLRPLPGLSIDGLENQIRQSLADIEQKWPNLLSITHLHEPIPGYECAGEETFIRDLEIITEQKSETVNYCTEAPFLQQLCPTLVLGPGSINQAHQPNEYLEHKYIQPTIAVLQQMIGKYCYN
ncbi:acetylornithine deacetylase [Vibrio sp. SS-MA-C1-2]|uniref:acetylornithine deacetylase n=1 Tax=Vibrio sp. SS-MA-C1-2 TaxID=2908646 RepID=UPI001F46BB4F|nr:acetylornithine deacetylase [Vibrio sp. SS-MA-C1-2]UJF19234.1 acetylornithine deacetylase [Vibrio sp. SS-MA-C1-2]